MGPVSFDRFQRLVVNYSYDLPFGKGTTGIEEKLINGWNVSGVTIAQTGNPLTFIGGGNGGAYGTNHQLTFPGVTTAQICPGWITGSSRTRGGARSIMATLAAISTAAFASGAAGAIGDLAFAVWPFRDAPAPTTATLHRNRDRAGSVQLGHLDREEHADHRAGADAVPVPISTTRSITRSSRLRRAG